MTTVVITGASRGLGLEFVKQLVVRPDHTIYALARSPDTAELLKEVVNKHKESIHVIQMDVDDEKSIAAAVATIEKSAQKIDLLINNAGIVSSDHPAGDSLSTSAETMATVYQTNVIGPLLVTQKLLPLLRKSSQAKAVYISSTLGSISANYGNLAAYRCSKAALNMLVTTFAKDVTDVTFLALSPGWVATDMGSAGGRTPPLQPHESIAGMLKVSLCVYWD